MNETLAVPPGAFRVIWVFELDLPEAEVKPMLAEAEGREDALAPILAALGVPGLAPGGVEVFQAGAFEGYGLSRYLTEGAGMEGEGVAAEAARLDALRGPVVLVHSAALPDGARQLQAVAPLRLVGRFAENLDLSVRTPPAADSAHPAVPDPQPEAETERKPPSEAAQSGKVATLALVVLFALVGLMIWMAG